MEPSELRGISERITYNSTVHDLIAPLYEGRHGEIFNSTEQRRIHDLLVSALKNLRTGAPVPRVLDFGAGTGNLTRHLLNLGTTVVAADVSSGCLQVLKSSFKESGQLELSLLNGRDLSHYPDESFDMVAAYSVLHHVPDYLAIVREFVRVVKPGGIVYIDHEVCPAYWDDQPEYQAYCREVAKFLPPPQKTLFQRIAYVFRQKSGWRYLFSTLRVQLNTVYDEGDIHVHPDDHIEWQEIRSLLEPRCDIVREHDYLVCREREFPGAVWEKWRSRCVDMRLILARKR